MAILGIDQGTTGTTAVLISESGKILGKATSPVPQHFPKPGWVEHDPNEIWKSVKSSVEQALRKSRVSKRKIQVIGLTNQRETVSLFEGTKPLHRFIVWQDRRTSEFCEALKDQAEDVRKRSGLPIDPYFSSTKIRWLKEKLKLSPQNSKVRFRTIDSFLLSKLAQVDAIEVTNASRTSLLHLSNTQWDQRLFEIFDVPWNWKPEVIPSEGYDYHTKGLDFLPDGIPIRAALGDQQAALFGQLAWSTGEGKITFGTGSFILLHTGSRPIHSQNSLISTVALKRATGETSYALEGSVFICGAWIQWLVEQLQIFKVSSDSEKLARRVKSSEGVMIVPALSGLGAPFWMPKIRGMILGLTRGSSRAHIARASLEALSFQNRALIDAMKNDAQLETMVWRVDGGVVKNNLLMEIQADVLGSNLLRPQNLEATATGTAWLAGLSHGIWNERDLRSFWKKERVFKPRAHLETESLYQAWLAQINSHRRTS